MTVNRKFLHLLSVVCVSFAIMILSCVSLNAESVVDSGAYMLLIPSTITGIQYDGSKLSGDYSTNEYYVLTYAEGETVIIKPSPGKYIELVSAADSSVFKDYSINDSGEVSFAMPATDLYLRESDEQSFGAISTGVVETEATPESEEESTAEPTKPKVSVYNSLESGYLTIACTEPDIISIITFRDGSYVFLTGVSSLKTKNEIMSISSYSDYRDSKIQYTSFSSAGTKIDNREVFSNISYTTNMAIAELERNLVYAPDYGIVISFSEAEAFPQTSVYADENVVESDELKPVESLGEASGETPGEGFTATGTVNVSGQTLNIRKNPTKDSEKIGTFNVGATVNIIDKIDGDELWYKVQFEKEPGVNEEGYVFGKFIQLNE